MLKKRLWIISNRLPLSIEQDELGHRIKRSAGGLVSAITAYLNQQDGPVFKEQIWAGVPDCDAHTWQQFKTEMDGDDYRYEPVFVEENIYRNYYNGFANSLLWPLFHYFTSYATYENDDYAAYMQVNQQFAAHVAQHAQADDMIWIHDYHLLPLAGLLKKLRPALTVGFFLHIPFPSFELFRLIPKAWQQALLDGVSGADLIGFQTNDDSEHFLDCIKKIMHWETDGNFLMKDNRKVKVAAFPISVDYQHFQKAAKAAEVEQLRQQYLDLKGDRQMIFSVDRLDYTKGLPNRLKAYQQFLSDNPDYIGRVVFVLVVVPSRDEIDRYAEKKKMIDEFIGALNSSLGDIAWQPVLYHYNHIDFAELVALYTACDLALITPLRDGMNLVAKEYIASQYDDYGVLILSEMAGAAQELTDALIINPNDTNEIATAIKKGLEMPVAERLRRLDNLRNTVCNYDVHDWAKDFLEQLIKSKQTYTLTPTRPLDGFVKVKLLDAYAVAKKRLLLFDYDGTLVPFYAQPADAIPTETLLSHLKELSANPCNTVYVISGRDSTTLNEWLGHLPLGLVAEHGARIKHPGMLWQDSMLLADNHWMGDFLPIMRSQVTACQGSFIEQKNFTLAWHYRNSEPILAEKAAYMLIEKLQTAVKNLPLQVLPGNHVVEVRPANMNKGKAVAALLKTGIYDFICCVGDDRTDEDMFEELKGADTSYTIKVGEGNSMAKYRLPSPYIVNSLLGNMVDYPAK